jgi:chemotaxis methyl-accepting protein methylase
MDEFKQDITYLGLLLDYVRSNRHILIKYEPERIMDRLSAYASKEGFDTIEELARSILLAAYTNRFNVLAKIHFATLDKQGSLDNTLINVLKNRLIYDLTQDESEVGKAKEKQSWLVKLMTKRVDLGFSQDAARNQLRILYLNTSRGFGAYNLNFEIKYLLPNDWSYSVLGIDPLKENVAFSADGAYSAAMMPSDYSHKDKFTKTGDTYQVKDEHKGRLEFQHMDILETEPQDLGEKFKEKFDLVVASEARQFYTLPVFFKIVEKVLPMLKVGAYLYTGVENIKDLKSFEHLDILSIDNIAFYRRNRNVIVKNVYTPIKEEEEACNNLLISAHTQFLCDNYDQVLQYTYHILNKEVDSRKAILIRCLALIGKGNYRLAKNMIRQAHILNAMDFDADLCSAYVNYKTGDYEDAKEDLHNALSHFNFNKIYRVIQCVPDEERIFLSRWERVSNLLGEAGVITEPVPSVDAPAPAREKKTKTVTISDERYGEIQIEVEPGKEKDHLMLSSIPQEMLDKAQEEPVRTESESPRGEGVIPGKVDSAGEVAAPPVAVVGGMPEKTAQAASQSGDTSGGGVSVAVETAVMDGQEAKKEEKPAGGTKSSVDSAGVIELSPVSPAPQAVPGTEEEPLEPLTRQPMMNSRRSPLMVKNYFGKAAKPSEEKTEAETAPPEDSPARMEPAGEAPAMEEMPPPVAREVDAPAPMDVQAEAAVAEIHEEAHPPADVEEEAAQAEEAEEMAVPVSADEPAGAKDEAPGEEEPVETPREDDGGIASREEQVRDSYKTAIIPKEFVEALKEAAETEEVASLIKEKRAGRKYGYNMGAMSLEPSSRHSKGSDAFSPEEEGDRPERTKKRLKHSEAYKTEEIVPNYAKTKKKAGSFDSDPYSASKMKKSDEFYKKPFDIIDIYIDPYKRTQEPSKDREKRKTSSGGYKTTKFSLDRGFAPAKAEEPKAAVPAADVPPAVVEPVLLPSMEMEPETVELAIREAAPAVEIQEAAQAAAATTAEDAAASAVPEAGEMPAAPSPEPEPAEKGEEPPVEEEPEKAEKEPEEIEPEPEKAVVPPSRPQKDRKRDRKAIKGYATVEIPDFSFTKPFSPGTDRDKK